MITGICHLVGGQVGVVGEIDAYRDDTPKIVQLFSLGWKDAASHDHWQEFVESVDADDDPMTHAVLQEMRSRPMFLTRARHQLVADPQWYRSSHVNEFRMVDGVDHCLYSYQPLPALGAEVVHVVEIHRGLGERRFSQREVDIVEWLHREIGPMIGRQLVSARDSSFSNLPPRLQQVMRQLLEGDSEKQIATRLGLSRATVHEYIQSLYRRCGVGNRSELMARWIRLEPRSAESGGSLPGAK
jgi:DNA-binding CsgD family transcriptional regulator